MRKHFVALIRFCPRCGSDRLERDWHHQSPPQSGGPEKQGERNRRQCADGSEWICHTCGFGFKITKSSRWNLAEVLIGNDRRLRNAVKFSRECVGDEVADLFEQAQAAGDLTSG